jgi:hypothetical protein
LVDWPWPRLSSAITRRLSRVSVETQPGCTQLTSLLEAKAVHQDDRIARARIEIGDLDVIVLEALHVVAAAVEDAAV